MASFKGINIIKLLISIAVCQLAGFIGSLFTTPAISTWYASLNKPSFTPPDWLFSPVWISLYFLMGISLFLVWHIGLKEKKVKIAIAIFAIQLILNSLWSVVFFGSKSPLGGFIVIIFLWIAILATIISFSKISKAAGILLVPYILWVSYAAVLNFLLFWLNR
jgi:benzodiazapine receptor